jgi:hypothetical protein
MDTHPWVVIGALVLLAYLFSGERKGESINIQPANR